MRARCVRWLLTEWTEDDALFGSALPEHRSIIRSLVKFRGRRDVTNGAMRKYVTEEFLSVCKTQPSHDGRERSEYVCAHAHGPRAGVNFTEHCDIAHTHACALHGGSDKIEAIRIRDCVLSGEVTNRN